MRRALAVLLVGLPAAAGADEVYLTGGGHLTGLVVGETAASVTVEVGPGRVGLARARVERIVRGSSALSTCREGAARLAANDVMGWLELARWAEDHDLLTQAREAYERVIDVDPGNAIAQRALGNVRLGDRWVSPEESYRARGYVLFEGEWMTPQEQEARLRERAEAAAARRAEAEARARQEEEERARAAEAEARRADTEADGGLYLPPYGWGFVSGGAILRRPHVGRPVACPPGAAPPPTRPPRLRRELAH